MADFVIDQKKIAKNTLFLYSRMFLILIVNFYAVRVFLRVLGIQDYGIFTIATGIVILFSILCNAMSRTTQRFLSIAIVKDEATDGKNVFSICFLFFLAASLVLVILAETIGLYFFKHKIQIPDFKRSTALFVYQLSILCIIISTLTIPFMSSVIAKEKMSFLAKIGIVEAVQKLAIALLLQFCCFRNALKAYSIMMVVSLFIVFICYFLYCQKNFIFCRVVKNIDTVAAKDIFNFSGWSLLGATANLAKTQGINVLLNVFHGVCFNTTWGVTSQVAGGVNIFINGFQQAFNPEILKSQKNKEKETFWELLFSSAKYSYLLFWFICSPLLMNLSYVLQLWLGKGNCPPQIELFIVFALIYYMFDCFSGPLWTAVEAVGHIMLYQLVISGLMISGVCVSYILFKFCGLSAYTAMVVNAIFNAFCLFFRCIYLKNRIDFPIGRFLGSTLLPTIVVTIFSLIIISVLKYTVCRMDFLFFCMSCGILCVCNAGLYCLFGFSKMEKQKIFNTLRKKTESVLR